MLPDVEEVQKWILGTYYRIKHQGRDRRGDGMVPVDPATGIPLSEKDLLPMARALRGASLALQVPCEPRWWAQCHLTLSDTPKSQWTEEDCELVSELEFRFKVAIRRLSERGLMNEHQETDLDSRPIGTGADGMAIIAHITPRGLEEAEKVIPGTKLSRGPVSVLHGMPATIIENAPAYARAAYKKEG